MQRIIVIRKTAVDYGPPHDEILCFRYISPENWLVDFENKVKEIFEKKITDWENVSNEFTFCNTLFDIHDFAYSSMGENHYRMPEVYSLDEWFEKNLP